MDFTNEFRVNLPPDEAWDLLTDVERIAPCMPGAQLTGVDGDAYNGVVKVKVGPMTVQYKGVVSFEEKDEAGRTAVLHARGRDTRGQGNADARVTARLVPDDSGTRVTVDTRLTITGRVAQFGKGMIEEISGRLLAQFVDNLEGQLAADRRRGRAATGAGEPLAPAPASASSPAPASAPAATSGAAPGPAAAGTDTGPAPGAETAVPAAATANGTAADASTTGTVQEPAPASPAAPVTPVSNGVRPASPPPAPAAVQPLNLMSVARGAVLKRALPAVLLLAVIVIALIIWLTR
ncbi:SRPBCC family protein [Streptomyces sp. BH-SS-21]|uniref:SRPBCC family protein n=1 Tax=Streptomyces liliiviolaceus TaxID=2823109 RepID=A0A941B8Z8_9ACTN|nr:SRPBCC family protein [Streptomyces liliiviolaceus]MBQ0855145.1 SRPBCC family protein [Streptomyces liliiviolaceus]